MACIVFLPNCTPAIEQIVACSKATSYDAKAIALAMAIHYATQVMDSNYPILYVDNETALHSLLDTSLHPSQICSILAYQRLRAWLLHSPDYQITLAWCLGHVNIAPQEHIDQLAKRASNLEAPNFLSFTHLRHVSYRNMMKGWSLLAQT